MLRDELQNRALTARLIGKLGLRLERVKAVGSRAAARPGRPLLTVRHQPPRGRIRRSPSTSSPASWDRELPEPSSEDTWWEIAQSGCDDPGLAWYPWSLAMLWHQHEPALLAAWIASNPGSRPNCWWTYSAPRAPAGRWPAWVARRLPERLILHTWRISWPSHSIRPTHRYTGRRASYLERHRLFLLGERRRLRKADWEPEAAEIGELDSD